MATKGNTTTADTSVTAPIEDVDVSTQSSEPQQETNNYQQLNNNTRMATTNRMTSEKIVLSGAQNIRLIPWVGGTISTTDHYDLDDIVEDTTSVTKEEGDETQIINEKGGVIKSNFTAGLRQFAADLGDLQNAGLEGLFGWTIDKDGNAYEPASMPELYVRIEITLSGGTRMAILPKVQLNSSVTMESLKSDIARGKLAGTAMNIKETITKPDDTTTEVEYSFCLRKIVAP